MSGETDNRDWWDTPKWRLRLVLFGLLALGVLCIAASVTGLRDTGWLADVVREFGGAFIVSAALGFTVEQWLRRGLAKDAFEGAMGYVLPPALREPVRLIAGSKWLARDFTCQVTIRAVDSELVELITATCRTFHNISDRPQPLQGYVHIDDWGYVRKGQITECEVRSLTGVVLKKFETVERFGSTVRAKTDEVIVGANDRVVMQTTSIEYKPHNSDMHLAFLNPIESPEINLDIDEKAFGFNAFCSGYGNVAPHPHMKRFTFKGTLLEGQRMVVRWYPRSALT